MLALNVPLSFNSTLSFPITYVPTLDVFVAVVFNAPAIFAVSPVIPVSPAVAVNVGFSSPYFLVLLSAVTSIDFGFIVISTLPFVSAYCAFVVWIYHCTIVVPASFLVGFSSVVPSV